jgi:hypothetical protein
MPCTAIQLPPSLSGEEKHFFFFLSPIVPLNGCNNNDFILVNYLVKLERNVGQAAGEVT